MIYLASPYSHAGQVVREERYRAACRATARLLRDGRLVFSPIVHGHPLTAYGLPGDWEFWQQYALWHLERCDELVVLTLDGWRQSLGVQSEIRHAGELGKPVRRMAP